MTEVLLDWRRRAGRDPRRARRRSCWRPPCGRWARRGPGGSTGSTAVGGRIEVQDHHDVAVHPVDPLRAQAVGGVLHLERAAVGGADHQDVLGPGVGAVHGCRRQVLEVDPVDLVVQVPGVPGHRAGQEDEHQGECPADPGCDASPGALLGCGMGRAISTVLPSAPSALSVARYLGLLDLSSSSWSPRWTGSSCGSGGLGLMVNGSTCRVTGQWVAARAPETAPAVGSEPGQPSQAPDGGGVADRGPKSLADPASGRYT